MTEEEALVALAEILHRNSYGPTHPNGTSWATDDVHMDADWLLLMALRDLGWNRLADAYHKLSAEFWYA